MIFQNWFFVAKRIFKNKMEKMSVRGQSRKCITKKKDEEEEKRNSEIFEDEKNEQRTKMNQSIHWSSRFRKKKNIKEKSVLKGKMPLTKH